MIENVKKFLRGNTVDIIKELNNEMQVAADKQKFEDAAHIRDRIEILQKYENSQKVVTSDLRARDIFAIAADDDDACAVIFKIREGKIIGRIHFYSSGISDFNTSKIIENYINQYYNKTDEIPNEIYLQEEINEDDIIEKWLSERTKNRVKIVVPKQGEKKKLINLCEKNARYLLDELKLQKQKNKESIYDRLNQIFKITTKLTVYLIIVGTTLFSCAKKDALEIPEDQILARIGDRVITASAISLS